MKPIILLLILVWGSKLLAFPCPQSLDTNVSTQALHNWLSRFQGLQEMKGCQVEFTACNSAIARGDGSLVGEVYIKDDQQREVYLPITLVTDSESKIRTVAKVGSKRLSYIKHDYFFEEEFGRTEVYRLVLKLDSTGENLKSLDLGTYSTRKKLHQPNGNQSRWYNCR